MVSDKVSVCTCDRCDRNYVRIDGNKKCEECKKVYDIKNC